MTELAEKGWKKVIFAADCGLDESGEFNEECPECGGSYPECNCPGPTMDGYEYGLFDGVLYARPESSIECSICRTDIEDDEVAMQGDIGIIPVALCADCNAGIVDYVFQTYGTEDEDRPGDNVVVIPVDYFEGKHPGFTPEGI